MLNLWYMEWLHKFIMWSYICQLWTLAVHASHEEALEDMDALLWRSHCSQLQQAL